MMFSKQCSLLWEPPFRPPPLIHFTSSKCLARWAGILSCAAQIQAWTDPEDVLSKGNFGRRAGRIKDISSEDIKQGTISSNLKYFHKRIKRSFNPWLWENGLNPGYRGKCWYLLYANLRFIYFIIYKYVFNHFCSSRLSENSRCVHLWDIWVLRVNLK